MTGEGIVTKKVQEAVNRIKKPVVLEALYANTKHKELTQGTSENENWHSWVRRTIQILAGIRGLSMILIFLKWQMMRFNEAVRRNRQKAEDRSTAAEGSIEVPNADFQILHVARACVNGTGSAHAPH